MLYVSGSYINKELAYCYIPFSSKMILVIPFDTLTSILKSSILCLHSVTERAFQYNSDSGVVSQ